MPEANLNRRRVFVGTAAVLTSPVAAMSAFAGTPEPDPVFAALQRHREACDRYVEAIERTSAVEEAANGAGMRWDDHPDMAAAEEAQNAASDEDWNALFDLTDTAPTTVAGAAAMAAYIGTFCDRDGGWAKPAIAALATVAETLAALAKEAAHG